jgi:hypothetical protein
MKTISHAPAGGVKTEVEILAERTARPNQLETLEEIV